MRRTIVSASLLCFLLVSIPGFSQTSSNAPLTGVVSDQSGALIPGVTITMTKTDTGVTTSTVTNEAGVYTLSRPATWIGLHRECRSARVSNAQVHQPGTIGRNGLPPELSAAGRHASDDC